MVSAAKKKAIAIRKYLRDKFDSDYVSRSDIDIVIEKRIVHHKIYDYESRSSNDGTAMVAYMEHPRYFFEPYGSVPWRISTKSMRALRKRYGNYRANRARDHVNAWADRKQDELSSYIMAQLKEYEKLGAYRYMEKLAQEGRL